MINLNQEWKKPKKHSPIVIFGAGSIVNDAHLPAYKQAGFKVQGIYDPDIKKAKRIIGWYPRKKLLQGLKLTIST